MRSWKFALFAIIWSAPLQSFAFLGMNTGATLQGPLPAWTRQLGAKGAPKQTTPKSVALDSSGNAYVTGYTDGGYDGNTLTGTSDYFLAKFDSSGTKVWALQKGVASKSVQAYGVATDASGNVIVAGSTAAGLDGNTQTGATDFFVVKYDSSGTRLWTQQLGVASKNTYGFAVTTDPSGNVFVVGNTNGSLDGNTVSGPSDTDAFVTKYNSSGIKQWTKQLGAASALTYGTGGATDSSGNVFVTGYTTGQLAGATQSGGTYELFISKYDSTGTILWTKQLGQSAALTFSFSAATDSSGNIFAVGNVNAGLDGNTLTGTQDFFVTKFDPTGTKLWTKQMGATSQDTYGFGLATDTSGNVFVTGYTYGGLDGNALTGLQDVFITKYGPTGTKVWTKQMGVPSRYTQGSAAATDSSGNVLITGFTKGDLDGNTLIGSKDLYITKYSSAGAKLWTKQKGAVTGSAGSIDAAYTAVDTAGNVYVTGPTDTGLDGNTQTGVNDYFIIKYNSSGVKQWSQQMGVASAATVGNAITVDSSGNVFITGTTDGALDGIPLTGQEDMFIAKYNSSGTKIWTKHLGAASAIVLGNAIALDSSGNIFVAGNTNSGLDGNTLSATDNVDFYVTKFDSSGTKLWTKQMGVPYGPNQYSYGMAVAADLSGNVFVAGYTSGPIDGNSQTSTPDLFVVKFDSSGTKLWSKQMGVSTKFTYLYGAATDSSGNIYLTGNTSGNLDGVTKTGAFDCFLIKFDSSGAKQWTRLLGAASKTSEGDRIAFDSFGNVFVAGYTYGALNGNKLWGGNDFFVTKYTSAGLIQWTKQFGVASKATYGNSVAVDSLGHVYVSGTTNGGLDNNTLSGVGDFFVSQYIGN